MPISYTAWTCFAFCLLQWQSTAGDGVAGCLRKGTTVQWGPLLAQNAWLLAGLWCGAGEGLSDRGDCLRDVQHITWRQCISGSCQEGVPPHASSEAHAFAGGRRWHPNLYTLFIPLKLLLQHSRLPLPSDTASILLLMCCLLLPTFTKRKDYLEGGSVQMGPPWDKSAEIPLIA